VKQLLIKLAALFGLVPARRYSALAKQLEETRTSAHAWKTRAGEASARAKSLEHRLEKQSRLLSEAERTAEKLQKDGGRANELREQLAKTEQELMLAREHLMAIEVKLDILEGAANVLDARIRRTIHQSTGTGAAV
jgi:hypothetical protein